MRSHALGRCCTASAERGPAKMKMAGLIASRSDRRRVQCARTRLRRAGEGLGAKKVEEGKRSGGVAEDEGRKEDGEACGIAGQHQLG